MSIQPEYDPVFHHDTGSKVFVESLFDKVNFEELYRLAWDVCLDAEFEEPQFDRSDHPEQALIQLLGVRGLSVALDITDGSELSMTDDERSDDIIYTDTVVRTPENFGTSSDPQIAAKVENFGSRLLDETYRCLGTDANEHVRRFVEAENAEEQIEVLHWLSERIASIGKHQSLAADDAEDFYHPIRLSPKVLGQYPHESIAPTCLMRSILAASFLKKADAPFLHAGVMMTRDQGVVKHIAEASITIGETEQPPTLAQERVKQNGLKLVASNLDNGFHAVSVARLNDGRWFVIDPNYAASYVMSAKTDDSQKLTRAYEDLTMVNEMAAGGERAVQLQEFGIPYNVATGLHYADPLELEKAAIVELLCDDSYVETQAHAKAIITDAIAALPESEDNDLIKSILDYIEITDLVNNGIEQSVFDEAFGEIWSKFILWDENPVDAVAQCQKDTHYLERRVEDFCLLPELVFLQAARILAKTPTEDETMYLGTPYHSSLELGLPAYRIGMSVLSDFASYCDDDVSLNFWASNWASRIPVTERGARADLPEGQQVLANNLQEWLQFGLKYDKQYSIIYKSNPQPTGDRDGHQ